MDGHTEGVYVIQYLSFEKMFYISRSYTKFRIPNGIHKLAAATSADNCHGVECRQWLTLRRQVVYGIFVADANSAGRAMVIY
jgi:hypothetical protein